MNEELSGRELDARIAELLGRSVIRATEPGNRSLMTHESGLYHVTLAAYSTDPAAAKELRQEMERRGWKWRLCGEGSIDPDQPYLCRFWREGEPSNWIERGYTEELATCRAALAALTAAGE